MSDIIYKGYKIDVSIWHPDNYSTISVSGTYFICAPKNLEFVKQLIDRKLYPEEFKNKLEAFLDE